MKCFCVILLLATSFFANSQPKQHKWVPGIQLGGGWSYLHPELTDANGTHFIFRPNFVANAGLRARIPLKSRLSFVPALIVTDKATKIIYKNSTSLENHVYMDGELFLQLNTNIVLAVPIRHGTINLGGGPYMAVSIADNYYFGGKDFGINLTGGYEFPIGFFIEFGVCDGLLRQNCSADIFSHTVKKPFTAYAGLSLGYMF